MWQYYTIKLFRTSPISFLSSEGANIFFLRADRLHIVLVLVTAAWRFSSRFPGALSASSSAIAVELGSNVCSILSSPRFMVPEHSIGCIGSELLPGFLVWLILWATSLKHEALDKLLHTLSLNNPGSRGSTIEHILDRAFSSLICCFRWSEYGTLRFLFFFGSLSWIRGCNPLPIWVVSIYLSLIIVWVYIIWFEPIYWNTSFVNLVAFNSNFLVWSCLTLYVTWLDANCKKKQNLLGFLSRGVVGEGGKVFTAHSWYVLVVT